ncbi:hypothetical protein DSECCO2_464410 [anaerobic digester metagenome]
MQFANRSCLRTECRIGDNQIVSLWKCMQVLIVNGTYIGRRMKQHAVESNELPERITAGFEYVVAR